MPLDLAAASEAAAASDAGVVDTGAVSTPPPSITDASNASPPAVTTPPASVADGGSPVASTGATAATPAEATAAWNLRNELGSLGLDPAQFPDDATAWRYVRQQLDVRAQEYERQRQIMAYQQQQLQMFQQVRQVAQPAPAPAAQPQAWWSPPEFDPMWERPFMNDKDGRPVTPADVDHSIQVKLQKHREWQREQFGNLLKDPIKTLEPGLKEFVTPLVQQAIQAHFGQHSDRQFANNWVLENQKNLFQLDLQGRRLTDAYGQPVLTPEGNRFVQYVQYLDGIGVKNPQQQQQMASAFIELEKLKAGGGQQPAVAPGTAPAPAAPPETPEQRNARLKAEAIARGAGAARLPGSGGGPPPSATTPDGGNRGIDPRLGLGNKLQAALANAGVSGI